MNSYEQEFDACLQNIPKTEIEEVPRWIRMNNCADIELLQLLQDDDHEAFRVLFDRYHHAIYRNIMYLLHDDFAAADLVQEVFICLWEKRKIITYEKPVAGWLFTVSYHKTVDYIRAMTRDKKHLRQITSEVVFDEKEAVTEQQYSILFRGISELSPRRREVFGLCKLNGYTYEQAAERLGISKHTVNEYMKEAVAFLRKYVKEHALLYTACIGYFFLT
ncbi:MAG TPA: sigma-70 family RNA polymerase sigma factor [Niabella sp.]